MKKLKKYCVLIRTYKKRFVIRDPELLNLIPEGVQLCWSQCLYWVLKEIPLKDLPIPPLKTPVLKH